MDARTLAVDAFAPAVVDEYGELRLRPDLAKQLVEGAVQMLGEAFAEIATLRFPMREGRS